MLKKHPRFKSRKEEWGYVLGNPQYIIGCTEEGWRILNLLEKNSVEEITNILSEEYTASTKDIKERVQKISDGLIKRGFLVEC